MILGHSKIQALVESNQLLENISEREKNSPEGCVIDLRLDKIFTLEGEAFLGIEERQTPKTIEIASYDEQKTSKFTIKPGSFYLTKTVETINLPSNVAAIFKPRSTTFRSGLYIRTGIANPGYHGPLYFALKNEGSTNFTTELGARYVSVIFLEVSGTAKNLYRGQWQGGRDHTPSREKQI